jgi:hypothetical protein
MKKPYADNVDRRFGRLLAVEYVGVRNSGSMWLFRCDCGVMHEATLSAVNPTNAVREHGTYWGTKAKPSGVGAKSETP